MTNQNLIKRYEELLLGNDKEELDVIRKTVLERLNGEVSKKQLYNLDSTIASFVLPRLKAFKHHHQHTSKFAGLPTNFKGGHLTEEEWMSILDQMIYSFEQVVEVDVIINQYSKYMGGMILFAQYFNHLWD